MLLKPDHTKLKLGRAELVTILALLMALHALAIDAMLPALDDIAGELGVTDPNRRQLVVGLFLLSSGAGTIVPGVMADRFGRKGLLMLSLVLYVVLSFACALVTSFDQMIVLRVLAGAGSCGLMVLPSAILRDQFEGDEMAKVFSLITAVFIIVPVFAPSIGQLVLMFAGWRMIFVLLGVMGMLMIIWAWFRLPETLHPQYRQQIRPKALVHNMWVAVKTRHSIGYVIGIGLVLSGVFGYVNSAQQLIGEYFGAGEWFPIVFGATAATMVFSALVNSYIVERFGARRVSHAGLLIFIVIAAMQVALAHSSHRADLSWFLPLMAANMTLLGFLGANFGSIAMQPFAEIAGAAASIQSFIRMVLASLAGIVIGQAYDGTAGPLSMALLLSGVLTLALVLYSEKGKLFARRHGKVPQAEGASFH